MHVHATCVILTMTGHVHAQTVVSFVTTAFRVGLSYISVNYYEQICSDYLLI